MSLNIISNLAAQTAQRNLVMSESRASGSIAKISAGTRVLGAKDDAAALAIGSGLRAEVSAMKQASVNAGQAVSMLQIADGAMNQINDALVRMKSLAVQAGSDQLGATERGLIDTEFQQLISEVERIASDTEFNGQFLIKGVTGVSAASGTDTAGTTLATALTQVEGVEAIAFDANHAVGSYSLSNDGTNLIATDLTTGVQTTAALPAITAGGTADVEFTGIGLTVTLNDSFDQANTGLLVSGAFSAVTTNLSSANGFSKIEVQSGVSTDTFSVFGDGSGGITVTNLASGLSQTVSGLAAPATGTTNEVAFDDVGVVITLTEDFDPTKDTTLVDVEVVAAGGNDLITAANGITALEVSSGANNDALQLTYDSATQKFTIVNLEGGFTAGVANTKDTVQLDALPAAGQTKTLNFTVGGEKVALTIDSTFDTTTSITTTAISTVSLTGGGTTSSTISIVDTSGDVSELTSATTITASGTGGSVAVFAIGNFVSQATNLSQLATGENADVVLVNNTNGATVTINVTVGGTVFAAASPLGGTANLANFGDNLFLTGGTTNNQATVTTTGAGTGLAGAVVITAVRGDLDNLTNATLTIDNTTNGGSTSAIISLGNFASLGVDLDAAAVGDVVQVTLDDGLGNEIDVSITIDTAFVNKAADDVFDATEYLEELVSKDGSIFDPAALADGSVTGGTGAIDTVRVVSVNGDVSSLDETAISFSNLADASNLTLTLSAGDGDDFTATGVDLDTAGLQQVTLSDSGGNSIVISFNLATAFDSSETAASIELNDYLANVTSATGTASNAGASDFTFKIGTGNESFDRITLSLDSVTSEALSIKGLDVTTAANADAASTAISTAITSLSQARSNVGAFQNRLEIAASNLATATENTEAARSALLDLDIASEMTMFTSRQLLVQAGVSMLAQANQLPQNLLRLLQ